MKNLNAIKPNDEDYFLNYRRRRNKFDTLDEFDYLPLIKSQNFSESHKIISKIPKIKINKIDYPAVFIHNSYLRDKKSKKKLKYFHKQYLLSIKYLKFLTQENLNEDFIEKISKINDSDKKKNENNKDESNNIKKNNNIIINKDNKSNIQSNITENISIEDNSKKDVKLKEILLNTTLDEQIDSLKQLDNIPKEDIENSAKYIVKILNNKEKDEINPPKLIIHNVFFEWIINNFLSNINPFNPYNQVITVEYTIDLLKLQIQNFKKNIINYVKDNEKLRQNSIENSDNEDLNYLTPYENSDEEILNKKTTFLRDNIKKNYRKKRQIYFDDVNNINSFAKSNNYSEHLLSDDESRNSYFKNINHTENQVKLNHKLSKKHNFVDPSLSSINSNNTKKYNVSSTERTVEKLINNSNSNNKIFNHIDSTNDDYSEKNSNFYDSYRKDLSYKPPMIIEKIDFINTRNKNDIIFEKTNENFIGTKKSFNNKDAMYNYDYNKNNINQSLPKIIDNRMNNSNINNNNSSKIQDNYNYNNENNEKNTFSEFYNQNIKENQRKDFNLEDTETNNNYINKNKNLEKKDNKKIYERNDKNINDKIDKNINERDEKNMNENNKVYERNDKNINEKKIDKNLNERNEKNINEKNKIDKSNNKNQYDKNDKNINEKNDKNINEKNDKNINEKNDKTMIEKNDNKNNVLINDEEKSYNNIKPNNIIEGTNYQNKSENINNDKSILNEKTINDNININDKNKIPKTENNTLIKNQNNMNNKSNETNKNISNENIGKKDNKKDEKVKKIEHKTIDSNLSEGKTIDRKNINSHKKNEKSEHNIISNSSEKKSERRKGSIISQRRDTSNNNNKDISKNKKSDEENTIKNKSTNKRLSLIKNKEEKKLNEKENINDKQKKEKQLKNKTEKEELNDIDSSIKKEITEEKYIEEMKKREEDEQKKNELRQKLEEQKLENEKRMKEIILKQQKSNLTVKNMMNDYANQLSKGTIGHQDFIKHLMIRNNPNFFNQEKFDEEILEEYKRQQELEKLDNEQNENEEKKNNNQNIENNKYKRKIKLENNNNEKDVKLIYDNSYLLKKKNSNGKFEIRKEVQDILSGNYKKKEIKEEPKKQNEYKYVKKKKPLPQLFIKGMKNKMKLSNKLKAFKFNLSDEISEETRKRLEMKKREEEEEKLRQIEFEAKLKRFFQKIQQLKNDTSEKFGIEVDKLFDEQINDSEFGINRNIENRINYFKGNLNYYVLQKKNYRKIKEDTLIFKSPCEFETTNKSLDNSF